MGLHLGDTPCLCIDRTRLGNEGSFIYICSAIDSIEVSTLWISREFA